MDVDWNSSFHSFISSIQYSPLQSVPLFTGCRGDQGMGGEPLLDNVYVTSLVVLTVPIGFVCFAMLMRLLILRCAVNAGLNREHVSKTLWDILLKSLVWFSLFSFPILTARYVYCFLARTLLYNDMCCVCVCNSLVHSTLSYFNCRDLGYLGSFMRSDYSIQCNDNPTYSGFLIVAIVNTILYPFGIPLFFYCLIRGRQRPWAAVASSPLHYNFTRSWAYFEVFELFRKLLLTSVVGFVLPSTASQCLFLFLVDILALLVLAVCRPYKSDSDDMLSGALITVECTIFLIAFLIVSDVYSVDNYDREAMLTTSLSLIIVALGVMVPLNVVTKIPSLDKKFHAVLERMGEAVTRLGVPLPSLHGLDARARYSEDLRRESMMEMKATPAKSIRLEDVKLSTNIVAAEEGRDRS